MLCATTQDGCTLPLLGWSLRQHRHWWGEMRRRRSLEMHRYCLYGDVSWPWPGDRGTAAAGMEMCHDLEMRRRAWRCAVVAASGHRFTTGSSPTPSCPRAWGTCTTVEARPRELGVLCAAIRFRAGALGVLMNREGPHAPSGRREARPCTLPRRSSNWRG